MKEIQLCSLRFSILMEIGSFECKHWKMREDRKQHWPCGDPAIVAPNSMKNIGKIIKRLLGFIGQ
jgi:hypothetical protein